MKKISLLLVIAIWGISCSKAKTSNNSANNPVILSNTNNANSILSNTNNQNGLSETNTSVNAEMLKQIEDQQLETADPRKAVNKNIENSNQSPKNPKTSGKQTW
jgi:hypothetical protein